jgi:hypothetical protein
MKRFWYACRRRVGLILAALEVHRVTFRENDGQTQVVKRRTQIGNLLLPAGNLYLQLAGAEGSRHAIASENSSKQHR